jgi:protein TonB
MRGKSATPTTTVVTPTKAVETDGDASLPKPSPANTANVTTASKPNQQQLNAAQQQQQQTPADTTTTATANSAPVSAEAMNAQLNAGSQLPQGARSRSSAEPPPSGFGVAGMDAASDNGALGSVFKGESKPVIGPSSVKVSAGVAGGMLIRKTPPEYPAIAKTARVSGTVVLAATITKSGRVSNLQVISGPQMLRQAAMDAVRNWLYKPYLLNNTPTEVQTTINVEFNL